MIEKPGRELVNPLHCLRVTEEKSDTFSITKLDDFFVGLCLAVKKKKKCECFQHDFLQLNHSETSKQAT